MSPLLKTNFIARLSMSKNSLLKIGGICLLSDLSFSMTDRNLDRGKVVGSFSGST